MTAQHLRDLQDLVARFEAHEIDPGAFHHAEHVYVAHALLAKHDFIDATALYAKGIRAIAAKAGALEKFSLTITYAFMSVIAERMADGDREDAEAFAAANPDIMSKHLLSAWYAPERLHSRLARQVFLLPDLQALESRD
ncbi:MAG: hypothetical protein AAFQ81_06605 [Pseudomonadota bacterium]